MHVIPFKSSLISTFIITIFTLTFLFSTKIQARMPHVINFRSPNLYPEGLAWDPSAQHFIVGSFHHRIIASVSDAGVSETLIFDSALPDNVTIRGLAVDSINHRLLAVIHATDPLPHFNALAAYDLRSHGRLFLSLLPSDDVTWQVANDVALDFNGNAYVTNSAGNYIWKVNSEGKSSVFSKSPIYTAHPVDHNKPYSKCGLNGVLYVSKGYLLVLQTNTGKMYKVDIEDGKARQVLLNEDLPMASGIVMRSDSVVFVVSKNKMWLLKSQDSWAEGVVYDKIDLDAKRFLTAVAVGNEDRVYVLYGHLDEALMGNAERDRFSLEEVKSEKEGKEDNVWMFVLIGFGLAYFMFWRFQMRQLVTNMDKKNR